MTDPPLNEEQFMWHHSSAINRASIQKHGLLPMDPHAPGNSANDLPDEDAPEGVYLAEDRDTADHTRSPAGDSLRHPGHDLWKVNTTDLPLEDDPDDRDHYWGFHYTPRTIPPDRLSLDKAGQGTPGEQYSLPFPRKRNG